MGALGPHEAAWGHRVPLAKSTTNELVPGAMELRLSQNQPEPLLPGAMVTGSGPGLRFSGPGFISGAKHDFLYRFFMLIPNF